MDKLKSQASKQDDKKLDGYLKDATDNLKEAQRIAKKPFFLHVGINSVLLLRVVERMEGHLTSANN